MLTGPDSISLGWVGLGGVCVCVGMVFSSPTETSRYVIRISWRNSGRKPPWHLHDIFQCRGTLSPCPVWSSAQPGAFLSQQGLTCHCLLRPREKRLTRSMPKTRECQQLSSKDLLCGDSQGWGQFSSAQGLSWVTAAGKQCWNSCASYLPTGRFQWNPTNNTDLTVWVLFPQVLRKALLGNRGESWKDLPRMQEDVLLSDCWSPLFSKYFPSISYFLCGRHWPKLGGYSCEQDQSCPHGPLMMSYFSPSGSSWPVLWTSLLH